MFKFKCVLKIATKARTVKLRFFMRDLKGGSPLPTWSNSLKTESGIVKIALSKFESLKCEMFLKCDIFKLNETL